MNRTDIINSLITKINGKKYLEIGVADGKNFTQIDCELKIGVDPDTNSKATIFQTSDTFFASNTTIFDIIFIDGLHHSSQVYQDIKNSLSFLSENGYIICHDMLPPDEEYQLIPPVQNLWTGDCWKAWVKLRQSEQFLTMYTVDTDFGCGIICRGYQDLIKIEDTQITWNNFVDHKDDWMNIISIEEFKNIYQIIS